MSLPPPTIVAEAPWRVRDRREIFLDPAPADRHNVLSNVEHEVKMPAADTLRMVVVIPASAERLYRAWLDGREHAAFTGAAATGASKTSAKFSAWDGYITGKNLELEPHQRIVQAWRTTEFPEDAPDSRLELAFTPASGGTRITLTHSDIPAGQAERYRLGWEKHYFARMKAYFRADGRLTGGDVPSLSPLSAERREATTRSTPAPAAAAAKPRKSRRTR